MAGCKDGGPARPAPDPGGPLQSFRKVVSADGGYDATRGHGPQSAGPRVLVESGESTTGILELGRGQGDRAGSARTARMSEAVRRYVQAALAGLAIAFVVFVASPVSPPTYLLAIGSFVFAGVLYRG